MQTLFEQQRLHYEQEKAQVAQEQRMREMVAEKRARETKERQDKLEAERKRKLEAARQLRELREKEEFEVLEKHRTKQQQVLQALNEQKEAFMQHHMELRSVAAGNFMGAERQGGLAGSAVTFEQTGPNQWKAVVDINNVADDDGFKAKRAEMQEEMKAMRSRLAAEKEKLLAEMDKRRRALQEVRQSTGVDAREEQMREREEAERIRAMEDKERQDRILAEMTARETAEREAREKEHRELEGERKLRLELEKRTLEAELQAEKAKFELEKMQLKEKLHAAQARQMEADSAPSGGGPNSEALEQIKIAMEAERQAQESILKAEQDRMQEMMANERKELEARLMREKAELEEKLKNKQLKREKAEESKHSIEEKIAETLKMFQAQLQLQQEQIAQTRNMGGGMMAGGQQMVPAGNEKLAWAQQQTSAVVPHQQAQPVANNPQAIIQQQASQDYKVPAGEEPSHEEIVEYAVYLGMNPEEDQALLYIAEWALTAPLPDGWTEHSDASGNEFYYNAMTGVSTYEHPLDEHYRAYYRRAKDAELAKG